MWEGGRGGGQGWVPWPWPACVPLETFLPPESRQLVGAGLARWGSGTWAGFVEEAEKPVVGLGLSGAPGMGYPGDAVESWS